MATNRKRKGAGRGKGAKAARKRLLAVNEKIREEKFGSRS